MERKYLYLATGIGILGIVSYQAYRYLWMIDNPKRIISQTPTSETALSKAILDVVASATAQPNGNTAITQNNPECVTLRPYNPTGDTVYGANYQLSGDYRVVIAPDGTEIGRFHRVSGPGEEFHYVPVGTWVCNSDTINP